MEWMLPTDSIAYGEIMHGTVPPAVKPLTMPRIGFNISGEMLHTSQFIHPYDGLKNLTETALNGLMPPMPTWEEVKLRHLVIVGPMESGKTSYANAITRKILDFYRDFKVNVVYTNDIATAQDNINRDPVQVIIIDDAVKEGNSRQGLGKKRAEDIGNFLEIRHVYERVARVKTGVIIVIYLTQRFKLLEITYRSGHVLIFKGTSTDASDEKLMRDYMSPQAYSELGQLSYRMFLQHDNTAKSDSIVTIPIGGNVAGEGKPCGRFHLDYIKPFLSKIGEREDGEEFYFNRDAELDGLIKDRKWKKKAKAYFLALKEPDITQSEIGQKTGIATQDQVSRAIKSVRGELSRIGGAKYEMFKVANLETRNFEARRLGGKGEPDVLATNKSNGIKYVVSCKCLDFDKNYTLDLYGDQGITPEIEYARDPKHDRPALILSVYNLHNRKEREFPLDPDALPNTLEFTPNLQLVEQ
jgi:hypothetical protein